MIAFLKKYVFLILVIFCFISARVVEVGLLEKHPEKALVKTFQKKFNEKQAEMVEYLKGISQIVSDSTFDGNYLGSLYQHNQLLQKEGYGFLVFEGSELKYWSDRAISFNDYMRGPLYKHRMLILPNGYYFVEQIRSSNHVFIGLILVKNSYSHENEYLENDFFKSFNLPSSFQIVLENQENTHPIVDSENTYLFSVKSAGNVLCNYAQLYFPGGLYFLGLLFLLIFLRKELKKRKQPAFAKLIVFGIILFFIYWLHILFKVPAVFYHLDFFSPSHFAYNIWLPTLGDYFLIALFFFVWALNFNFDFSLKEVVENSNLNPKLVVTLFLFATGGVFIFIDFLIRLLIENSNISFSLSHIITISPHSIIGYLSIGLFFMALVLLAIKIIEEGKLFLSRKELAVSVLLASAVMAVISFFVFGNLVYFAILFFMMFTLLLVIINRKYLQQYTLSYLIIFISIVSLYSLFLIYDTISNKERKIQKLLAVNLVAEHDPAAEVFLKEIQKKINVDSIIPSLLIPPFDVLEDYLATTYFNTNGFFGKFDLQITTCTGDDDLLIQPEDITVPCFPFFEGMIKDKGLQIPGTNFYFMDNMDGRISYFGKLHYPHASETLGVSVHLELATSLASEGIGYPELLIDKSMQSPKGYEKFSHAKYYAGKLVDQHGDYLYNYYVHSYDIQGEEFSFMDWDNHEHVIYRAKGDNYVIVSREKYGFLEYLISFPYLFVFYFILVIIFLVAGNRNIRKKGFSIDLKFKVQASIISIVFVSLLVVAIGTIFYNINEFQLKHRDDLNEKMESIAEEIDMRLHNVNTITPELEEWLLRELAKLSNVFRTDINIFGTDGDLISSSRPEIYSRGLVSTKMNSEAYYELYQNYQINYFQPEHIGQLSFLSAYEPIINDNGDYLGFINLPYFIRQDRYRQETTTFIVAFINLYVLLFLASIIVAIFLANQITRPLTFLRENLRKIELGKHNEPIGYARDDEIGNLIKEYNKKVEELSVSADLLARSERETAWREMAKQIAHEIKNPLTPMKLNIQYLQRAKNDPDKTDDYFDRVTKTLIEQIDTLSDIATEFSNFAKIPDARNEVFNLSGKLKKVIHLFEKHDKATIHFSVSDADDINVKADREQLSRAIINLIKNGIQSIPENQEGKIEITLRRKDNKAIIEVKDNGQGIPEEIRTKLFSPSFTTKSSGMGLGLAIVKNIVTNFKGQIWYNTKLGIGTIFFIEIPIYENEITDENNSIK